VENAIPCFLFSFFSIAFIKENEGIQGYTKNQALKNLLRKGFQQSKIFPFLWLVGCVCGVLVYFGGRRMIGRLKGGKGTLVMFIS